MLMYKHLSRILVIAVFLIPGQNLAQVGGSTTYSQLDLAGSARQSGLGGSLISIRDQDISLCLQNPTLLDSTADSKTILNYVNYIGDINYGFAGYAKHYKNIGTFMAALQYNNYGKFTETDAIGNTLGKFNAADYSLNVGCGRQFDSSFSYGGNLKLLYSQFERYNSLGAAVDLAASYYRKRAGFSATIMFKNIGYQFKPYVKGNRQKLPFQLQAAFSKRLKHAPLRLHVSLDHLLKWDLSYIDPTLKPQTDPATGEEIPVKEPGFTNKLMRHITPGAELLIGKNFYADLSYNYRRRQENKYSEKPGLVGFAWGFGIRIKKFSLAFSRARYHLAGASNQVTIAVKLSEFGN